MTTQQLKMSSMGIPASRRKVDAFGRHLAELSDGSGAVRASALDLMAVHTLAPNIMLLDVADDGTRDRIRFMGTALVSIYGAEATNRHFHEIALGLHKDAIHETHRLAIEGGHPVWSRASHRIAAGPETMYADNRSAEIERLAWPLYSDDGRVARLVEIVDRTLVPSQNEAFSLMVKSAGDFA